MTMAPPLTCTSTLYKPRGRSAQVEGGVDGYVALKLNGGVKNNVKPLRKSRLT